MRKIKRVGISALLLVFLSLIQFDAAAQVQKGNVLINAGLGFGYYYAGGVSLTANAEFSITDEIAVGPYLAYTRWDYGYFGYDYHYNFIDFGARGTYHFAKLLKVKNDKFDPYAGVFLGFVSSSYTYDGGSGNNYSDSYDGGVRSGIYAGARYYFSDKFAGFGELGIGLSPLVLGVTFKL
ncbi:MAG: hypothetical protein JNM57_16410 [Cyclobacteriaceae bacterium]|nr:hypothetical protein [Cyclobacteriaceae bacterium]